MESILGIRLGITQDVSKYEKQAQIVIKKAEDIIARSEVMTEATLDGEHEWCLTLQKKESKNGCYP